MYYQKSNFCSSDRPNLSNWDWFSKKTVLAQKSLPAQLHLFTELEAFKVNGSFSKYVAYLDFNPSRPELSRPTIPMVSVHAQTD